MESYRLIGRLVAPVCMLAVFLFCAQGYYFSSDDPFFLVSARQDPAAVDALLHPVGRWLNAALLKASFGLLEGIGDLVWLRMLTAVLLMIFAAALARLLFLLGVEAGTAISVGTFALLTPATMPILAWAQHWTVALGGLLVASGFIALLVAEKRTFETSLVAVLCAGALLFLAASINQQLLGFSGVFFFMLVFHARSDGLILRRSMMSLGAICIAYLSAYISTKMVPGGPGERAAITSDISGKIDWFLSEPLPNASLLVLFPRMFDGIATATMIAWLVLSGIAAGIMLLRRGGWAQNAVILCMFAVAILLSYGPTLAVSENWASYRTLWPLQTLLTVALLMVSADRLGSAAARRVRPVLAATVVPLLALWLYQYQTHIREPYLVEARHAQEVITQQISSAPSTSEDGTLRVVYPHWSEAFSSVQYYDDIGGPSVRAWTVVPLVRLLLQELGRPVSTETIKPISFEDRETLWQDADIIDLTDYAGRSRLVLRPKFKAPEGGVSYPLENGN